MVCERAFFTKEKATPLRLMVLSSKVSKASSKTLANFIIMVLIVNSAHIRGTCEGSTFEEGDITFDYGEGECVCACVCVCV